MDKLPDRQLKDMNVELTNVVFLVSKLTDRLIEAEKKINVLENQAKIADSFIHRHDVMI